MKFLILICFTLTMPAFAIEAPSYLENGRIRLTRPGGVDNVSSDEFALVKRANLSKYKTATVAPKCKKPTILTRTKTVTRTRTLVRRNTVLFHVGAGRNGIFIDRREKDYLLIKQKNVPVFGATYLRHARNGFGLGASAFTSNTYTVSGGYSF